MATWQASGRSGVMAPVAVESEEGLDCSQQPRDQRAWGKDGIHNVVHEGPCAWLCMLERMGIGGSMSLCLMGEGQTFTPISTKTGS